MPSQKYRRRPKDNGGGKSKHHEQQEAASCWQQGLLLEWGSDGNSSNTNHSNKGSPQTIKLISFVCFLLVWITSLENQKTYLRQLNLHSYRNWTSSTSNYLPSIIKAAYAREEDIGEEVPRRLIFVHTKNNILQSQQPQYLYENLQHTIQVYAKAWRIPVAEMQVEFWDDPKCREFIQQVEPRLLIPYLTETYGAYASDICRTAGLYLKGGYYFDNDVEIIQPIILSLSSSGSASTTANDNDKAAADEAGAITLAADEAEAEAAIDPSSATTTTTTLIKTTNHTVVPEVEVDFVFVHSFDPQLKSFVQNIIFAPPKHKVLRGILDSMVNDWYYNPVVVAQYYSDNNNPLAVASADLMFLNGDFYQPHYQELLQKQMGIIGNITIDHANSPRGTRILMGPTTMRLSYDRNYLGASSSTRRQRPRILFLNEIYNDGDTLLYPQLHRNETNNRWKGCNYLIHDAQTQTPYYYSRCRGTDGCPYKYEISR